MKLLPMVLIAWFAMFKTKAELETVSRNLDDDTFENMVEGIGWAREAFEHFAELLRSAETRIMCAAASAIAKDDPEGADHVCRADLDPDPSLDLLGIAGTVDLVRLIAAETLTNEEREATTTVLGIAKRQLAAARDRLDAASPNAAEADEGPPPERIAQRERFERLYCAWHIARAGIDNPDMPGDDESANARARKLEEAERALLTTPAPLPDFIWWKWECLDQLMTTEADSGAHVDNRAIVAVACIKADVLKFGLKEA
jgi:hypothetical protein